MAEDAKTPKGDPEADAAGEVTLELDAQEGDLDAAMRDAVAAVEEVEAGEGDRAAAAAVGNSQVEALSRELQELRDRSVRTLADFDNYRKRAERERQEIRRYALLEPLRELLPVTDNLERALSAGGTAEDLKAGVAMILRQLTDALRRVGVQEVPTEGKAFDPALHEAVAREERSGIEAPTVVETLGRGYFLHDRLLRPAMVKVAVPMDKRAAAPVDPPGGD